MTGTQKNPLAENFNAITLLRFAFPSMSMMLFMGLYTVVDTIFLARFVSTNALSAVNIVCPVINLIVGLGTMLATGGNAVIAKKMGNGSMEEARRNFTLIVVTGAAAGLVITVTGLVFLDQIIWGLGASEMLFPDCKAYLTVQLVFAAGNMMQVLYQNLFVTAGRPGLGLTFAVLAGLTNMILDYVLIVLLHMGIRGAAFGTGIGYMIPTLAGTVYFLSGKRELHFCMPEMDGAVLWKSCTNGASEMVSQCAAAVTTFLFNGVMMRLAGEDGVAAITVMIYAQFLLTTLYIGFSMGTAPVISYHDGSGNKKQLRKMVRICFGWIAGMSVFVFLISLLGGERIARIFAAHNAHVFEMIRTGFSLFSFGFLFSGCNIFASALFTALSNGAASAVISFLRTFGFLLFFLLVMPEYLGMAGVWLAVPAAELLTFILAVCMVFGYRRYFTGL